MKIIEFSIWCILVFTSCTQEIQANTKADTAILESNKYFGNKLYKILSETDGNLVFSPFSVHAVLSLLYAGANAKTKTVLKSVLHLPEQNDASSAYKHLIQYMKQRKNVTLEMANKIYAANKLKLIKKFESVALKNYDAEIEKVDFKERTKAAKAMNEWIEKKTHKKIHDIIKADDIDPDVTRLILFNTLYFNGEWAVLFKAEENERFYVSTTETVDCTMLTKQRGRYEYASTELFQLIRLPYKDSTINLTIVLPRAKIGLADVEKKFTSNNMLFNVQGTAEIVDVSIPKFKIENEISLKSVLQKVGLQNIFQHIDLAKIFKSEGNVVVSEVFQKVFIDVNEKGTEAAAATEVQINYRSGPVTFKADRPFLFFLEASVGGERHVLFQGRVTKPEYK